MWLFRKRNNLSDEQLAAKYFATGDKSLLGDLFEKHVKTVYGACIFYFKDKEIARDAVMQIFEKLILELRKNEVRNFKGWLSFVVRNYCINELRKNKGRFKVSESYLDFEVKDPDLDEEEKVHAVQEELMLAHLRETLTQLKENQRVCVEMFYLKGLSYEEIKNQTGFSLHEVKSYIQNGKRNLKLMIEERLKTKKR